MHLAYTVNVVSAHITMVLRMNKHVRQVNWEYQCADGLYHFAECESITLFDYEKTHFATETL